MTLDRGINANRLGFFLLCSTTHRKVSIAFILIQFQKAERSESESEREREREREREICRQNLTEAETLLGILICSALPST